MVRRPAIVIRARPPSLRQTSILNKHLNEQMEGLTAKVFRTFNASRTLQEQLDQLTQEDMTVNEKVCAIHRSAPGRGAGEVARRSPGRPVRRTGAALWVAQIGSGYRNLLC